MPLLSYEHVGSKISAKIKIYVLTRAKLLFPLSYEIPCMTICKIEYYSKYQSCKVRQPNLVKVKYFLSVIKSFYNKYIVQINYSFLSDTNTSPNTISNKIFFQNKRMQLSKWYIVTYFYAIQSKTLKLYDFLSPRLILLMVASSCKKKF